MKKLLSISTIFLASAVAFAAWNQSIADGDWTNKEIWSLGAVPTAGDGTDGTNIMSHVTVTSTVTCTNGVFVKPDSSLTILEGGNLNLAANTAYMPMDGGQVRFLGGQLNIAHYIFHNGTSEYVFGGLDGNGVFHAAIAKSINSSFVVQLNSGHTTTYNVGASNLLTSKSTGMDENAILWAGNQLNPISGDLKIDVTNVDTTGLADGTYYVALAAFNNGVAAFDTYDIKIADTVETDEMKVVGLDWANSNSTNNTLYAVVQYTKAIPEPSTYAAIFGALALAFVAYRRHK